MIALAPLRAVMRVVALTLLGASSATSALATTPLADRPVVAAVSVPGNVALALSFEFPTFNSVAYTGDTFDANLVYLGYFDPRKCYEYVHNASEPLRHFAPSGATNANRACVGTQQGRWSGNFMNWATMQTVDVFRWVLTGGTRSVDTTSMTLLERARNTTGTSNFPLRSISGGTVSQMSALNWGQLHVRGYGTGTRIRITHTGNINGGAVDFTSAAAATNGGTVYELSVRIRVCDNASPAGLEANCERYPASNYKPTRLMHTYADRMRFSAFGYLNDSDVFRDAGVLRARQKFVGPSFQLPNQALTTNPNAEWNANTGIFEVNPNPEDATATRNATGVDVQRSGVINYLNLGGQLGTDGHKVHDPVSELYYAVLRYFKAQGNVPEWRNVNQADMNTRRRWVDFFPVITQWDAPMLYSCQRNFVLGIGDTNLNPDKNVPGNSARGHEPSKPPLVQGDTTVDAVAMTNRLGLLHGLGNGPGQVNGYGGCCTGHAPLMTGMAYHANSQDIRPDDASQPQTRGMQTLQTYWVDVMEWNGYKPYNAFYLAAKYGGFTVPQGFNPLTRTSDIPQAWWRTTTDEVYGQPKPDTYFIASQPEQLVVALNRAFASMASRMRAFTSAFSTSLPQVSSAGTTSFSSQFDSSTWTGELTANQTTLDASTGTPTRTEAWRLSLTLDALAASGGWNTARRIATWNNVSRVGVPFRHNTISSTQLSALDSSVRSGNDAQDVLNYLRGDKTHEVGSSVTGSARAYRSRSTILGDIGQFKARPVGRPDAPYAETTNPGYVAFKTTWASRPTVVYVGTNAGVVHAVHGALTGADAGRELFAYVPGALYSGPSGAPAVNGLQALANPDYEHRNYVDATPTVADVDFGRTQGGSGTDWRTLLVGGLGKGGRAIYALDITNPMGVANETHAAARVLWEFTDPDLGFVFGEPAVVKTAKHGWVVIAASGYNNADGKGYLFFIHPRTGALLDKVSTGTGASGAQAGLAHLQPFLLDRSNGTADAVYAGDLLGNLWRFDLTAASGTLPAPLLMAELRDAFNQPLPVTSRPLAVVHPESGRRYVTVGTGRMLDTSDSSSSQGQRFFAIIDGNASRFYRSSGADLPSAISWPVRNNHLRQLTDLTQEVTLDFTREIGWYFDLGQAAGVGWRVITDATSFFGTVAFAAMQPGGTTNPCEPGGSNRIYAIDLGRGISKLTGTPNPTSSTPAVPFVSVLPGVVTDLRFFSANGKPRLIGGSDSGDTGVIHGRWGSTGVMRRMNWREVILAE